MYKTFSQATEKFLYNKIFTYEKIPFLIGEYLIKFMSVI